MKERKREGRQEEGEREREREGGTERGPRQSDKQSTYLILWHEHDNDVMIS